MIFLVKCLENDVKDSVMSILELFAIRLVNSKMFKHDYFFKISPVFIISSENSSWVSPQVYKTFNWNIEKNLGIALWSTVSLSCITE